MECKTLEDLDLSVRSYNCLKRAEINTLEDITQKTEEDMFKIRNLGRKNLEEVKWKLKEFGLTFKDETPIKLTGREKFNLCLSKMTNEDLSDLTLGGSCPSEFGLFDKKESGCPVLFCTSCWKEALDMEY